MFPASPKGSGFRTADVLLAAAATAVAGAGVAGLRPRECLLLAFGLLLGWAVLRTVAALRGGKPGEEASVALLKGVIEGTSDAIFVKDAKGKYLLINQAGARILGKSVEEVLGGEDREIYSEETSRLIQKSELTTMLGDKARTSEEVRSVGGVSRIYSVTRAPYRDGRGEIVGVIGIARDITERREAEALVRRHTEALTRALKLTADKTAPEHLVDRVLRAIAREQQASFVSLFVRDGEAGDSEARAVDETARITEKIKEGGPEIAAPASIGDQDPAWLRIVETRAPLVIDRVADNPLAGEAARRWALLHGLRTLLAVPLLWGNEVIGVLSFFHRERREFRPEELETAQALVHLATLALQLTRMARQRQDTALIEERNRMAREIHDTLAQGFTAIIFQLEAALELLEEDSDEGMRHIDRALAQARESLAEARRSVAELKPRPLENGGLGRALHELVEKNAGPVRLELAVRGASRALSPEVEINLLKIAQEAVTNALKHAKARTVQVELSYGDRETSLSVQDDGLGFSPGGPGGGYGLSLMRERAETLKGRFDLSSRPGQGTRVSVSIQEPAPAP